jgi:hypothetical protein
MSRNCLMTLLNVRLNNVLYLLFPATKVVYRIKLPLLCYYKRFMPAVPYTSLGRLAPT